LEDFMHRAIAIVLFLAGALILASGFTSFTTKEKVVDVGPVEITRDKKTSLPGMPLLGVAALIAGGVVLASAKRQ
jgi:hypothetical protein